MALKSRDARAPAACVGEGAVVDYQKVSELLLREFRQGVLGRITLDSPVGVRRPAAYERRTSFRKVVARCSACRFRLTFGPTTSSREEASSMASPLAAAIAARS
jgi:hypothetical protein